MGTAGDVMRDTPVAFEAEVLETELHEGWQVVTAYAGEECGPFLVDLSHRPKWDVQHASLSTVRPWGLLFPETPGQCRFEDGRVVTRMNYTQGAVWSLRGARPDEDPEPFFTETTEGLCLLALAGRNVPGVLEKITPLDLAPPEVSPPFLVQGPVLHIPCQVVVLGREGDRQVVLIAFSRGYGQAMAEAILEAGHDLGLRPGGQNAFLRVLEDFHPPEASA